MTIIKAALILVAWRTRQFDTHDIAHAVSCSEADVCRVIHAARERERGPDLHIVESA